MTSVEKLTAVANEVGGNLWGVELGKPRIYLQSRLQDVKVFLDFPKATDVTVGPVYLRIHGPASRHYKRRDGSSRAIKAAEFRWAVLKARDYMVRQNIV